MFVDVVCLQLVTHFASLTDPAFEQSTKSVEEAARAERERRGQLAQKPNSPPPARTLPIDQADIAAPPSVAGPSAHPSPSLRDTRFTHLHPTSGSSLPASPRIAAVPRLPGPPPAGGLPSLPTDEPQFSVTASSAPTTSPPFKKIEDASGPRATRFARDNIETTAASAFDRESPVDAAYDSVPSSVEPGVLFAMVQPSGSAKYSKASRAEDEERPGTSAGSIASEPMGPSGRFVSRSGAAAVARPHTSMDNPSLQPPHSGAQERQVQDSSQPRSPFTGSRLKGLGRSFRRAKGDAARKADRDSGSDASIAFGSSPEPFGPSALERASIESRTAYSQTSHASTLNDEVAGTRTIRRQTSAGGMNGHPLGSAGAATPRDNHTWDGQDTEQLMDDDGSGTPVLSPRLNGARRLPAMSGPSSSGSLHSNHRQHNLPGEDFTLDPFARQTDTSTVRQREALPAVSPGSIPPSADYWSASADTTGRSLQQHLEQSAGRNRSATNLRSDLLSPTSATQHDTIARDPVSNDVPQSKGGSRLARAFSKRRPRTSISDLETNRSLSPESGFRRISSSTAHGSAEGARSSSSHERARGRTSSVAGSIDSQQFPSAAQDGSRLEASGGAAALFGGGASSSGRPRTASLLPSLSIFGSSATRSRLSPNAHAQGELGSAASSSSALDKSLSAGTPMEFSRSSQGLARSNNAGPNMPSPAPIKEPKGPKIQPIEQESASEFAARVERIADRSEVASILASSGDKIYSDALHSHMQRFLFVGNPLDIALRKMLMDLCLPKETQQIDRVMEAFAKRYNECNEGLYGSEDQPYILAFSLMMLHTDAFNRNAKVKMTKADYVKNSSSSGVPQDILEYLYDNLTFTQFVYSNEADSQRKALENGSGQGGSASGFLAQMSGSAKDKGQKIDAYLLIKQGRLSQFQPAIENVIPEDDPYSYTGTAYDFNIPHLARAYMSAPSIEIAAQRSTPPAGGSAQWPGPELSSASSIGGADEPSVTLRVFKVGIISRKDDITDKSKKQNRRWKPCGMILSSSQLLFFRDLVWIEALHAQIGEQLAAADPEERKRGILIAPRISNFRPDGVLSLGDAIAVRDESYDKHHWVLRLIGIQGTTQHEYLFHTRDETDMNEWISGINFCACFRAFGIRVTNVDAMALTSANRDAAHSGWTSHNPGRGSFSAVSSPPPEMLRARIAARRREVMPLLEEVDKKLDANASELAELLRLARHFAILTPFQRATRERIEAAAIPLAARIRQLRILVAKNECRRYILASEIQVGDSSINSPTTGMSRETSQSGTELTGPQTPVSPSLLPERKGSYFSTAESTEGLSPSPSAEGLGLRTMPNTQGSGRTGGLGSVSEVSELEPSTPAVDDRIPGTAASIGSFANQPHDPASSSAGSQPGTPISSSRSFKLKFTGKNKSRQEVNEPFDVAESWQSTRAFRDPDRISLAQLPSIEQIEAATREKARRRGMNHAASTIGTSSSRKGSYAYSGSSVSGSYRGDASSMRKGGSSHKGSSNKSGPKSGGSGSSGKTNRLQNQPTDPPVFMHTWGS